MKLKKTLNLLASRKFALILLGTLTIFSVVGMIIPQDNPVNQQAYIMWSSTNPKLAHYLNRTGLTNLFYSPVLLLISFFLFASNLICSVRQYLRVRHTLKALPILAHPSNSPLDILVPSEVINAEKVCKVLKKNGYLSVNYNRDEGVIRAIKYPIGYWGSLILHLGFIVIISGALLSSLTKMQGYIYLGEGQAVKEVKSSYWQLKEAPLFQKHKGFTLILNNMNVKYPEKELPYPDLMNITVFDGNTVLKYPLRENETLNYRGVKLFPDQHGYAVALEFTDELNHVLYSGFFHLRTFWHGASKDDRKWSASSENYSSSVTIPRLNLQADMEFYPNYQIIKGIISSKSLKPVKPALSITLRQNKKLIYKGFLEPGHTVKSGNYKLFFPEYRNNQGFKIVSDQGTPVIFAGFWISFFGLMLLYVFNPKLVWIKTELFASGNHLLLWGSSPKFPCGFQDELSSLAKKIAAVLAEKGEHNV